MSRRCGPSLAWLQSREENICSTSKQKAQINKLTCFTSRLEKFTARTRRQRLHRSFQQTCYTNRNRSRERQRQDGFRSWGVFASELAAFKKTQSRPPPRPLYAGSGWRRRKESAPLASVGSSSSGGGSSGSSSCSSGLLRLPTPPFHHHLTELERTCELVVFRSCSKYVCVPMFSASSGKPHPVTYLPPSPSHSISALPPLSLFLCLFSSLSVTTHPPRPRPHHHHQ